MVEFNKKISPDKNVLISSIYPDLYQSKNDSGEHTIGGGKKEQAYLSRFTLPNNPSFGGAELKRLDYHLYVKSIDLAPNIYALPEASIYKTKDSENLTISEGAMKINAAKTKDVTLFTSHITGFSSLAEDFSGQQNAGGDAVDYQAVQRTVIRQEQLYTTPTNAYKDGRYPTGWRGFERNDYTIGDFKRNYAVKASELGITNVDGDTSVIPVRIESPWVKGKYKYSFNAK